MLSPQHKEFNNILKDLARSRHMISVFRDFLEMSHIALANSVYLQTDIGQEMEARYFESIKQYSKEELEQFSKLLALTAIALQESSHDFLGQVFMANDMGNEYRGQFFTPYHISQMMTQIIFTGYDDIIKEKGYISMQEPTCGSGGMVIACAETLHASGYDVSKTMWAEARDIDSLCFMMTYIQLSVLGVPARVVQGNTLTLEENRVLYTPAFIANGWFDRLGDAPVNNAWAPEQIEQFKNGTLC